MPGTAIPICASFFLQPELPLGLFLMATCKTVPMVHLCAAPQVWLQHGSAELLNIVAYFSISLEWGLGCSQLMLVAAGVAVVALVALAGLWC